MSVQGQIDRLIAFQAAQWYERLRDGVHGHNAPFVQWLTESPRHMEAFLAVAAEAPLIRKVLAEGSCDLRELLRDVQPEVMSLPVRFEHPADAAAATLAPRRRFSGLRLWAVAAVLAVISISAVLYQLMPSWQRFETQVGEQRALQLAEGSIVNLNAQSRVAVNFKESQRDVRLLQGEATFKVAPDSARPFRVHTSAAVVEAVGTQFNVYARSDGTTTVTVLEGKVTVSSAVSPAAQQPGSSLPLVAGEEARVGSGGSIEREHHADVAEAIAWQQRKLIFKRTALEDMAAEFNRYNKSTRILLQGIEPGSFRFTGAFDADDPQSLAVLLAREPGLSVERRDGEILIRGRQP